MMEIYKFASLVRTITAGDHNCLHNLPTVHNFCIFAEIFHKTYHGCFHSWEKMFEKFLCSLPFTICTLCQNCLHQRQNFYNRPPSKMNHRTILQQIYWMERDAFGQQLFNFVIQSVKKKITGH